MELKRDTTRTVRREGRMVVMMMEDALFTIFNAPSRPYEFTIGNESNLLLFFLSFFFRHRPSLLLLTIVVVVTDGKVVVVGYHGRRL